MRNETISIYKFIAYALDFEGCIRVGKHKTKNKNYQYTASVYIGNIKKELLENFKNEVGFGSIDNGIIRSEDRAKIYYWSMTRKEIEKYLPLIESNLIIKWRQAQVVIELYTILKTFEFQCKLNNQTRLEMYTWEEHLTMEAIWKECAELNEDWNIKNKHSEKDIFYMNLRKQGC